jgi:hypothetical protein
MGGLRDVKHERNERNERINTKLNITQGNEKFINQNKYYYICKST